MRSSVRGTPLMITTDRTGASPAGRRQRSKRDKAVGEAPDRFKPSRGAIDLIEVL